MNIFYPESINLMNFLWMLTFRAIVNDGHNIDRNS